jgi:hypothetical protein
MTNEKLKNKIKTQLLEVVAMLQGGYTTDIIQLKRLLGIENSEEEYFFTRWLEELEIIGSIETMDNDKIFII